MSAHRIVLHGSSAPNQACCYNCQMAHFFHRALIRITRARTLKKAKKTARRSLHR